MELRGTPGAIRHLAINLISAIRHCTNSNKSIRREKKSQVKPSEGNQDQNVRASNCNSKYEKNTPSPEAVYTQNNPTTVPNKQLPKSKKQRYDPPYHVPQRISSSSSRGQRTSLLFTLIERLQRRSFVSPRTNMMRILQVEPPSLPDPRRLCNLSRERR